MGQGGGAGAPNRQETKSKGILSALKNSLKGQVKAMFDDASDSDGGQPGAKTPSRGRSQAR